jgi:hypothetical protein
MENFEKIQGDAILQLFKELQQKKVPLKRLAPQNRIYR